jgi:threonine/homoserine/homoserine lactone efflux protein
VVLLLLAFNSLNAASQGLVFRAELPFTDLSPVLLGLLLSIINPFHVPFWIGWTAVLKSKHVLNDNRGAHNFYVLAIGLGTALAFLVYALAGRFLVDHLQKQHVLLNWIIGIALLITALVQFYRGFFMQPAGMVTQGCE